MGAVIIALAVGVLALWVLVLAVMVSGLRDYTAETLARVRDLERRVSVLDDPFAPPPVGLDAPPHRER